MCQRGESVFAKSQKQEGQYSDIAHKGIQKEERKAMGMNFGAVFWPAASL